MTLVPMPASRDAWLALRGERIGASEVAALFDVQAAYHLSRFALWHVKAGTAPAPEVEGPRLKWGTKLEEVIALAAAEENDWTVARGRYAICDDAPIGASLDFEIERDPTDEFNGPGVLETKNADWLAHKRSWQDDEPPPHILMQMQSQCACTGYAWGAVVCLIGGNDLRVYRYAARTKLIAEIKARATAFWRSIAEGKPPPVDGSDGAGEILRSLYPEVIDDSADMRESNGWPLACADFLKAGAARKEANVAYELAKNQLVELLGQHKRGWGGGFSVSTVVTPAQPDRPAVIGEIVKGRAETRRYTVKEKTA